MTLSSGYNSSKKKPAAAVAVGYKLARSWRRLLNKEKNKFFGSTTGSTSTARARHAPAPCYDEYTYSQNFDQGFVSDEPDCLYRSFSMRFAAPRKLSVD